MSEAEDRVAKNVDEAIEKVATLNGANGTPPATRDRLREILTHLALRSAVAGLPDKCVECENKLDSRLRVRCPKHVGIFLATDFAKSKAREHGPVLAAKAVMAAQGLVDEYLSDGPEPDGPVVDGSVVGK